MSTIKGRATFEFTIPNNEVIRGKNVYSPVFSTADNMFWQLEYQPVNEIFFKKKFFFFHPLQ
jgi:hypothetical protein